MELSVNPDPAASHERFNASMSQESGNIREIAQIAQARRESAIPKDLLLPASKLDHLPQDVTGIPESSGHFTADELSIISSSVPQILSKVHSRQWTSTAVTKAFIKSAAVAQQLVNCLTEVLFDSALARAAELDAYMASTGKPIGPFHGLPISLKDCFITPPHPSSIGLGKFANVPTTPDQESILVTLLKQAGAILHVKTNTSPAMMAIESTNNVWGATLNPYHRGCSAGGSSGGEAALIAMRGAPIGIGTDIGGSIRIPAAFQHLYGLKPSYGRYSHFNSQSAFPGQEVILSINGPLARDLSSISAFSAAIVQPPSWALDPKVLPIPWSPVPAPRTLRLAIMPYADPLTTAHPPVQRALAVAAAALQSAGHTLLPWSPTHHAPLHKFLSAAFLDFGATPIMRAFAATNEPCPSAMGAYAAAAKTPEEAGAFTPAKMREINVAKNTFLRLLHEQRAQLGDVDAIIAPVSPWAAPRLGVTNGDPDHLGRMHYPGYTAWVNPLDWPALTFPVLRAERGVDVARGAEWRGLREADDMIQADYEADFYDGAPVSLQAVGYRLQEERLVGVVERVVEALREAGLGR